MTGKNLITFVGTVVLLWSMVQFPLGNAAVTQASSQSPVRGGLCDPGQGHEVSGNVSETSGGDGIEGAFLFFYSPPTSQLIDYFTTTNSAGDYHCNVATGSYRIHVCKIDYMFLKPDVYMEIDNDEDGVNFSGSAGEYENCPPQSAPTSTATSTAVPPTPTATHTGIPPTMTPTATETPDATPMPTVTATISTTATVPPKAYLPLIRRVPPTPTPTFTPEASATPTVTATPTCIAADIEPNTTIDQVLDNQPLCSGIQVTGLMSTTGDTTDYYRLVFTETATIRVTLSNIPTNEVDFDLYLYNADRQIVARSEAVDSPTEEFSYIVAPAVYYVRVNAYEGRTETPYHLIWRRE